MRVIFLILISLITSNANADQLKVAILDSGLDMQDPRFTSILCKNGHKDFTGTGLLDTNGHGTHIAGLIKQYAGKSNYCLLIFKHLVSGGMEKTASDYESDAIEEAISQGAKIINVSAGGSNGIKEEFMAIGMHPEVLIVAAAGNFGWDLDDSVHHFFPASYPLPNVVAVGMLDNDFQRDSRSNFGEKLIWEIGTHIKSTTPKKCLKNICTEETAMTGTSQAAAIHTGKLIKLLNKGGIDG